MLPQSKNQTHVQRNYTISSTCDELTSSLVGWRTDCLFVLDRLTWCIAAYLLNSFIIYVQIVFDWSSIHSNTLRCVIRRIFSQPRRLSKNNSTKFLVRCSLLLLWPKWLALSVQQRFLTDQPIGTEKMCEIFPRRKRNLPWVRVILSFSCTTWKNFASHKCHTYHSFGTTALHPLLCKKCCFDLTLGVRREKRKLYLPDFWKNVAIFLK